MWHNEQKYDALVDATVVALRPWPIPETDVTPALKALIGIESGFDATAHRGEPQLGDASVGLMQVLLSTARGLGYTGVMGDPEGLTGLFWPDTNVWFGARLFRTLLGNTRGDLRAAASAYNGGYRPALGFGGLRTASTPVVCLQWKASAPPTGRTIAQDCAVTGDTTPGHFSNQRYVDRWQAAYDYFFHSAAGNPPLTPPKMPPPTPPSPTPAGA